jgi:hypothetical protein
MLSFEMKNHLGLFFYLGSLLACATAATPPMSDWESVEKDRSPPSQKMEIPKPDANGVITLNRPEALVQLCETLREPGLDTVQGSAVEQERQAARRGQERHEILNSRFVAFIPSTGFAFSTYDMESRRLLLDQGRQWSLGEGAELIPIPQDPIPGFAVGPELADRLMVQRASSRLALRAHFRIAGSQIRKDPCAWISGGHVVRMEIDLLGTALLAPDGTILARGDTGEFADGSLAMPVKNPRLILQTPRTNDGKEAPAATVATLATLKETALPCYTAILANNPGIRGTLVLGFRVGIAGQVESPHAEMSSLGNDELVRCVAGKASQLKITGLPAGTRMSLPMLFSGKDD